MLSDYHHLPTHDEMLLDSFKWQLNHGIKPKFLMELEAMHEEMKRQGNPISPRGTPAYILAIREIERQEANQRAMLPEKSENIGQFLMPDHIDSMFMSPDKKAAYSKRVHNLLLKSRMTPEELADVSINPAPHDDAKVISDVSSHIVNDSNCYYTMYVYNCPTCHKEMSFVDVLSIRFLEEEDKKETGTSSFLELSDVPVTSCPSCNTEFVFSTFNTALHYDDKLLKRTRSYKLVQTLRNLAQVNTLKKAKCNNRPIPETVKRSISFIRQDIVFADHGYSYVVNNYECTHCHKQYAIGDISSVRKEPALVPKYARQNIFPSGNIPRTEMWIYRQAEESQNHFPNIQWGITPYCTKCGYNFYPTYDLYDDEPVPAIICLPSYDDSLLI